MNIMTPCVGVCKMHEEYKICKGCLRSRYEIAQWVKADDNQKQQILHSISQKLAIYGNLNNSIEKS